MNKTENKIKMLEKLRAYDQRFFLSEVQALFRSWHDK